MEIVRIINNNVVSSRDDKGREVVVMGKRVAVGEEMITLLV
ncbi:MAG: CAT RNA binding domain-containing protein [Lachnospiraceae bacterium]|nr:CAT RNA binding domain-containing protein [Lachnospiraceae bacterium]